MGGKAPRKPAGKAAGGPSRARTRLRTIADLDLEGRRVLVREDFNVPLDEQGRVASDHRIRASVPGIREVLRRGASAVVLMSHLGRPKGPDPKLRLDPVGERLAELLDRDVTLLHGADEPEVADRARGLGSGAVALLENLRFYPGEQKGDEAFAARLASLGDRYVNDAFGAAHRADASVALLPRLLPSAAGPLLSREIEVLEGLLDAPARPFVAILGGAKVADKIPVIQNLLPRVNAILIGGGMAYTFLKARGEAVGGSRVEEALVDTARAILSEAGKRGIAIELPGDHRVADAFRSDAECRVTRSVPEGWMGLDIGPETAERFAARIAEARTVAWNGPVGVFEFLRFGEGTKVVAEAMARHTGLTVVGGGDTAAAVESLGLAERMGHVSTGGGASLELLAGEKLPGVEPLRRSP